MTADRRDLAEFLLARIAEDEAVAREAHYEGQRWLTEEEGVYRWPDDELVHEADRKADARHIVRWDPARVLAECDAKRRIVEVHQGWHICPDDDAEDDAEATSPPPCLTLRSLAILYADHPDYEEAWRP